MLGNILVGRYQILRSLGGGGFGETYIACDTQLPGSPQCVVKKLKPQANDLQTLQTARRLFHTEAEVLHQLGNHPQIPQLLAYFEENQEFYLVQEFIEGNDLSEEIIPGKPWTQDQITKLLQELLEILEFIHQKNVIHRDLNPRNILRRNHDGKLILIDFGAVKQITTNIVVSSSQSKFTVAIGTPGYTPSEQAQGNPKFSSDIYAVGIIGIQALTGISPENFIRDPDSDEIIWCDEKTEISTDLEQILDKMVRYDFRDRFSSATLAMQAIKEITSPNHATIPLIPIASTPAIKNVNQKANKRIILKGLLGLTLTACVATLSVFIWKNVNAANATELYKQANTFYELQRYQDALNNYEKAVEIQDNYAEAWYGKGKALSGMKKYQDALTAYDKAIQLQPEYLQAWRGRGFTLYKLQRYNEAIASIDKTLASQNDDAEAWEIKADSLDSLKRYDEAIQAYDKAIENQADYYQAWYKKAKVFQGLKRYQDAVTAYDKTLELKPNYADAFYSKGNSLVNLNRYQDAANAYDQTVKIKPDYYQAWLSKGNTLIILQRYQEALEAFDQVIKYNPSSYQAWYSRGLMMHQLQRYDTAIESYDKAIALRGNAYQTWYARGNSLFNLKKYNDALTAYNRSIRYNSNYPESWYSKGNTLLNLQRNKEAIASLQQAIKIKPDYQQAINVLNQLKTQEQAGTQKCGILGLGCTPEKKSDP
ncbi:serine/threonine-protein kinase [Calothrix sp. PCC 6303]|uniref:serine/threonine-protein kinase n=1 Tax=Calothrix sp. PCC 6303 TaxID=1170562 RepID=UPI0002A054FC|nr:serine/threonine-protein kinase [Calothrix sp. PCC 6303]AFZ03792.1 serine/threonine protein kinase with TPR repeats [Calothrix sp. PCC 6303]